MCLTLLVNGSLLLLWICVQHVSLWLAVYSNIQTMYHLHSINCVYIIFRFNFTLLLDNSLHFELNSYIFNSIPNFYIQSSIHIQSSNCLQSYWERARHFEVEADMFWRQRSNARFLHFSYAYSFIAKLRIWASTVSNVCKILKIL